MERLLCNEVCVKLHIICDTSSWTDVLFSFLLLVLFHVTNTRFVIINSIFLRHTFNHKKKLYFEGQYSNIFFVSLSMC